ncbi:hypothetical protein NSK_001511 [Nannochloropsis salina CCMP1776]|uniref:START domain-containing protein n=1 Tax=Nannochloropsis salina CCMP1776 TaxID=1027361 RepID=A0A4D9DEU8_9STRA|nr:hypothetical protein NSK_001511 [Nannochloropsis salina CCMP1776]|eukprot:TFJ87179.1 hypothetical protein NSK_001511 [Nannochloropsis salina CCMP1776]
MLMLVRLLLVVVACGVLVVSRVLIVQGDTKAKAPSTAGSYTHLPLTFGGLDTGGSSEEGDRRHDLVPGLGSSKVSYRRLRKATRAAAADSGFSYERKTSQSDGVTRRLRPFQAVRTTLQSQVRRVRNTLQSTRVSSAVAGLLSRFPPRLQRRRTSERRPAGHLSSFAERLLRQLRRQQAHLVQDAEAMLNGDAAVSLEGVDPRYLSLLRSLEEEGHQALGDEGGGWHPVSEKEDTKIWRRNLAEDAYGREYPCLKLSTMLHASPEAVMDLLVDSERVGEYNKYSKGRDDVARVGPHTKIVWNRTLPPLQKKAHEFCTIMHVVRRPDGSQVMLTKFTDHPEVPRSSRFARSEIILGVTEVRPHPTDPNRAHLTTISHVKSAGIPPFIAEKFSVRGVVDFAESLRKALHLERKGPVQEAKAENFQKRRQDEKQDQLQESFDVEAVVA